MIATTNLSISRTAFANRANQPLAATLGAACLLVASMTLACGGRETNSADLQENSTGFQEQTADRQEQDTTLVRTGQSGTDPSAPDQAAKDSLQALPESELPGNDPYERVAVDAEASEATRVQDADTYRSDRTQVADVVPVTVADVTPPPVPTTAATAPDSPSESPLQPETSPADDSELMAATEQPVKPEGNATVTETVETTWVTVESGSELEIEFLSAVSSEWSEIGDEVRVRVSKSHLVDGTFAIPAGSELVGEVLEATPTKRFGGQATLAILFNTLELAGDDSIDIDIPWSGEDSGQKKKDATRIGGGAAAGAAAGSIFKDSDGAKMGALIGAAIGAARAAKDRGEPVELPEGSVRTVILEQELEVPVWIRHIKAS